MQIPPLNQTIDSTYLTLENDKALEEQAVTKLCKEAIELKLRAVCIRLEWVSLAKQLLQNSSVKIATVVGFPTHKTTIAENKLLPTIGNVGTEQKIAEIQQAHTLNVDELDVVLNTAFYQETDTKTRTSLIQQELLALKQAAKTLPIKLILECDTIENDELLNELVALCCNTKIDVIKNATGYVSYGQGATVELIRKIKTQIQTHTFQPAIKASAGIKTTEQAEHLVETGATILGTSNALAIISGQSIHSHTY